MREQLPDQKHKKRNQRLSSFFSWFFQIVVVIAFGVVISMSFFQTVTMQETSMDPTMKAGDVCFLNQITYRISSPKRGDIIAFRTSMDEDARIQIKRVIGLPGDTIQIKDGQILIDGATYREGRDLPSISHAGLADTEITLESGEYFVLGDNRNNSEDSRYAEIGNVQKRYIVGKVWFRIIPFQEMGFLRR